VCLRDEVEVLGAVGSDLPGDALFSGVQAGWGGRGGIRSGDGSRLIVLATHHLHELALHRVLVVVPGNGVHHVVHLRRADKPL